jgi:hypothetical protein
MINNLNKCIQKANQVPHQPNPKKYKGKTPIT